jgi:uroporphyrinogen-III synthase
MSRLDGVRVALTRPDAGELGDRLTALGATVVHVPLIEIGDAADGGAALRAALARLAEFDWLVVTSANGAHRVGAAAREHPALRLAAVGPTSAAALAAGAGRPVDLVPAVARAEGLLAEFPPAPVGILLVQADRARRLLADGLVRVGHRVESVTAYRTVSRRPTPGEIEELRDVDAVVFASGSAVAGWVDAVGPGVPHVVVALGPVTADAARSRGVAVTHVAAAPEAATVADVVAGAFA